ncbi:hypothetical protein EX259_06925 [Staphylococcus epidermidis]|nr:hypothetical protein [Staphylococcus epidermidis]NAM84108.1 hypothetical protein [Staphylococcus epidermidis]NAM86453.1 hypothetical protein [Staphylococcus epidermidis]
MVSLVFSLIFIFTDNYLVYQSKSIKEDVMI